METDYQHLQKTKREFKAEFLKHDKHFEDSKNRDIYKITLKRGKRECSFDFGQSIANSKTYRDRNTKEEFFCNGMSKKGSIRTVSEKYLKNYCIEIKGKAPSEYDVLACLQKYDVGTFEEFCGEFGYDTDSKKAEKTYLAVKNEFDMVQKLWSDKEIEELQEI